MGPPQESEGSQVSFKAIKIIAEFCQNHNGDFGVLRQMIDAAAEGGATHAKIQSIFAKDLSFRPEFEVCAEGINGANHRPYVPEYWRLKALEITYAQHEVFVREAKSAGLEPLTTAFNLTSIPEIKSLGWRSVKVASYDCGSIPLIDALSDHFEELIISTGATYDEEIESSAKLLKSKNAKFTFLHCVTLYPTPLEEMHLNRLNFLRNFTESVGLSNHSLTSRDGIKADLVAIHLGADAIERHFTVLPPEQTRDGPVSITKAHLKEIVEFAKLSPTLQSDFLAEQLPDFSALLGEENRVLTQSELQNRKYYRGRFCNKVGDEDVFNWEEDARQRVGV